MNYEEYLQKRGLSQNTIRSYVLTAGQLDELCPVIDRRSLACFRETLARKYAPASVNQKIQAANSYLDYRGLGHLRIRSVGVPSRRYLQKTLSLSDYGRLKSWLRKNELRTYYFSVQIMAKTGVRVSELMRLTVNDARKGYGDVCGKGGKLRRVYFPGGLQTELEEWLDSREPKFISHDSRHVTGTITSGQEAKQPLMLNRFGKPLSPRGLSGQLKIYAQRCGVNPTLVHPHAFRHLFARQFLAHGGDIALLADLLGHSSLETTRIYLRQTAEEQRACIDELICW